MLEQFISDEKIYFSKLAVHGAWEDNIWNVSLWLAHRGKDTNFVFHKLSRTQKSEGSKITLQKNIPIPQPYSDFIKATAVHIARIKNVGFMAVRNYVIECRRLYNLMSLRNEESPAQLTRWHFEETLNILKESGYKKIYEVAANLKVIADLIDKLHITPLPLEFNHGIIPTRSYHEYTAVSDLTDENARIYDEKLPSYDAMKAYAVCTNNPINDDEEILIRMLDLLIAMGQRGNEVALIPLDCWVEVDQVDKTGKVIIDAHGNSIKTTGIRYFAEKNFQSRVHWLATQDIAFAKRAVDRLKILTSGIREVAKFQEESGRLWKFAHEDILSDVEILKYLSFAKTANLRLYLTARNKILPVSNDSKKQNNLRGRAPNIYYYKAGDIENFLLPKLKGHAALRDSENSNRIVLRTSEVLGIRYEGAFRFLRSANTLKVLPGRIQLVELNIALGAISSSQSIFDRRNLFEANGSRISLTSHQPRHWRNTLYELAGMSNVQQALAMGRQMLDQNPVYQHETLAERSLPHREFLSFSNPAEKITFLHEGIRSKQITGGLANTYFHLIETKGHQNAEGFLKTHATALHITPFGGCTHDFSLTPCAKYLQCWNGCSHLHLTGSKAEAAELKSQLEISRSALEQMKIDGEGDYGSDIWIADLELKIKNLEKGLKMKVAKKPVQVFPDGKQFTIPFEEEKQSSVSEK